MIFTFSFYAALQDISFPEHPSDNEFSGEKRGVFYFYRQYLVKPNETDGYPWFRKLSVKTGEPPVCRRKCLERLCRF